MITITKQENGVLFTFENSDKYLYGNGTIEVPFNTLSIIADESDMIILKKAASNDVFISGRYDTDFGYRSKDDAIDDLKGMLFAETGGGSESGITSGEVQTMIDESISGKADTSDVTAVANDVQTVSGQVATKVAITDFNTYSAATDSRLAEDEEVTAAALNNLQENKADTSAVTQSLSAKQDALVYYTEDTENKTATIDVQTDDGLNKSENRVFVDGGDIIIESYNETDDGEGNTGTTDTQVDINSLGLSIITYSDDGIDTTQTELKVQPMGAYINSEPIATEPYVNAAITGKVDTSAITTAVTSGSTDDEIPTAKAVYDAIPTGGGAAYSAGTNISIDTGNTINCTLNLRNGTGQNSIVGVQGEAKGRYNFAFGQGSTAGTSTGDDSAFAFGTNCKARKSRSFAYGATNDVKEIDSAAFGQSIILNAPRSFAAGYYIRTNNWVNIALGEGLTTNNRPEFATGAYNNSVTGSTASGQTLFSVGNGTGTADNARHNAFEIRQNGDIYVNDGTNDVRLQDTILALGGLKLVKLTQSEYDQLATKDPDTLYIITNVVS